MSERISPYYYPGIPKPTLLQNILTMIEENGGRINLAKKLEVEMEIVFIQNKGAVNYWSADDVALLIELYNSGYSVNHISEKLNRTIPAIEQKVTGLIRKKVPILRRSISYL